MKWRITIMRKKTDHLNPNFTIVNKCLRCVVFIERFPCKCWIGKRTRCGKFRMILLIFILKEFYAEGAIIQRNDEKKQVMYMNAPTHGYDRIV